MTSRPNILFHQTVLETVNPFTLLHNTLRARYNRVILKSVKEQVYRIEVMHTLPGHAG